MLKVGGQCSKAIILMYILEVTHKITLYTGNGYGEVEVSVAQSCLTLRNTIDCSPPDSSLHGILQARRLEWVTIPFSRRPPQPRDQTQVSHIAGGFFTVWASREAYWIWRDRQIYRHKIELLYRYIMACPKLLMVAALEDVGKKMGHKMMVKWDINS